MECRFRTVGWIGTLACLFIVLGTPPAVAQMDFGDAPSPDYPTTVADDGARHGFSPLVFLGAAVDYETDGQPSSDADGDDAGGGDDEDGILFTTKLFPGEAFSMEVDTSGALFFGQMNAWIDFNRDGDWADAGEQILTNEVFAPGGVWVRTGNVPEDAEPGITYARFRFSTANNLSYNGAAPDGEVEDYMIRIEGEAWDMDFGDAPEPLYPTRYSSDGARHEPSTNGPWLGWSVDAEADGRPSYDADGDDLRGEDDEDGVTLPGLLVPGGTFEFDVSLAGSPVGGYVNAWVDFDGDGDWGDPGEHVMDDEWCAAGSARHVSNSVPEDASAGHIYARFRCSSVSGLSFTGAAPDGEVEDYRLSVLQPAPAGPIFVTGISQTNGVVAVTWDAPEGIVCQLQAAEAVDAGAIVWSDVGTPVLAPRFQTHSNGKATTFYRVTAPFVMP